MIRKKRRYDYGDYYTKPLSTTAPEGAIGQAASPYYSSSNLNTLSTPQISKAGQTFNNNQGLLATAGTALGEGLSANAGQMVDTEYTQTLNKRKQLTKTIGTAASAINPLIGAGVAIGSGIGAQTVNEFGEYKSQAGNAVDEMVNPVTGVQGVLRAFKGKQTGSGVLNKLSLGIFGKSDNQKEAEEGRREFERQRIRAIRERSQQTLADYPVYGIAKYGMKFPMGGQLPYPTDDSEAVPLASNVAQYEGSTHENGGIDLDIDGNGAPEIEIENDEVIKDDMVLSNRLAPSKLVKQAAKKLGVSVRKGDTYAKLAARIGKKKGDFEQNLTSTRPGEKNSAELMVGRLDEAINMLFMDQQVRKFGKESNTKFPNGGRYKTKNDVEMPYDPELRAALAKWEQSEANPPLVQQMYPQIRLTQGAPKYPYYPVPSPIQEAGLEGKQTIYGNQEAGQEGRQTVYNPKFPGGGVVPYNLDYLKIHPLNTPEQAKFKAEANLNNALRFKNSLHGNVVPQMSANMGGNPTGILSGTSVINSYATADPRAVIKADSTIDASRSYLARLKGMNGSLASRAFGGYLPTFASGGPFSAPRYELNQPLDSPFESTYNLPSRASLFGGQPPIYSNYNPGSVSTEPLQATTINYPSRFGGQSTVPRSSSLAKSTDPATESSNTEFAPQPRNFDVGDYKTDIAAGIGTIANQIQIANLETEYNPTTVDAPRNSYTDRTGYLINQSNEQYRTATQGIQGSSSQDNLALRANLYAKSLSGLNQTLDQETQRKDVLDSRHNELVNRTNIINANISNQGKFISMENRNKKRALTQANLDNLVRSYIGNEAVRDAKSTEFSHNYMSALRSGDRGVSERYINSLPATTRRKLGYR
jgi:hypothetical protein